MLNPSTADAQKLDPTVTRCLHYSQQWQFATMIVCNLFAYRATDPRQLLIAAEPVGKKNDYHIRLACREADRIILAWGNHGIHHSRADGVRKKLRSWSEPEKLYALRINKSGEPAHPLYLPGNLQPDTYHLGIKS